VGQSGDSNDSDYNSDYGDDNDDDYDDEDLDNENEEDEQSEEKNNLQRIKDKEYFVEVMEYLKNQVIKVEGDLENLRNKKIKGPPKKQKEKQGQMSYKLTQVKKMRDKIEEITNSLDYLEVQ
jgi:hypothetical protein